MSDECKPPDEIDNAPQVLRLSRRDAEAFARALISPPEPTAGLLEAARRYLKTTRQ